MSVSKILLEQIVRVHTDGQNKRRDDSDSFDRDVWAKVEELGLPMAMCSESRGGFGLRWSQLFGVIAHSAACGEPTPLGETLLGNAVLTASGAAPAEGPIYFWGAPPDAPETARRLTEQAGALRLARPDAGEQMIGPMPPAGAALQQGGALLRSVQIAGALQGALDLSVRYAQERVQFGRPLSKFQAVQHMLAQLAGEAAAAAAAARTACSRMDAGNCELAVAIAKLRAGRAVEKGVMLAHQIHGAIGVTLEYPLARLSRNMWSWAEQFGDQRYWAIAVGRAAVETSSAWDVVVAASDPVGGASDE